jgi:hypothetical protein
MEYPHRIRSLNFVALKLIIWNFPFIYPTNKSQLIALAVKYRNPKSFVSFLLPPQGIGEGWGGVKNLQLI